jgi:hypothetical protein
MVDYPLEAAIHPYPTMTESPKSPTESAEARPFPQKSPGLLSDLRFFFLHRPDIPTLVEVPSEAEREDYSQRILQRLGIDVTRYAIVNIHKIGIEAPVNYVFEQLMTMDGTCWPNHIASVERVSGDLEHPSLR